jgi:hypothetical protein
MGVQNLDEHKVGELSRCGTGAWEFRRPLADTLVEKPLQDRRPRRSGPHVDQRREDIRQKASARRVQLNMAANEKAVISVAKLRDHPDIGGEHTFRVNRYDRQIAGEDEGTLRRKETHVSRFKT